ncbi:hypothetical protein [Desertivirga xinjiangensis]|uniref:hypothetical protein n=1 Tax=Desertivirga xinjiangensis TaxID=539206 RepID=UPI00210DA944|nr:hypothetical protein [Pedobacter xinjiangensis]
MWFIAICIPAILLAITLQDIRSRLVYAFWFPLLIVFFIVNHVLKNQVLAELAQTAGANICFLMSQFLLLKLYFSIKWAVRMELTEDLIGWGDILFLISIAFYFSTLNFVLFYLTSLIIVLLIWLSWSLLTNARSSQIPLAGLQAFLFCGVFITDWHNQNIDFTRDSWLLEHLAIWI